MIKYKGILSQEWNQKHCRGPLNPTEFEKQWKSATKFIGKQIETDADLDKSLMILLFKIKGSVYEKYAELNGNIYYQINEIPEIYVIAWKQKKSFN